MIEGGGGGGRQEMNVPLPSQHFQESKQDQARACFTFKCSRASSALHPVGHVGVKASPNSRARWQDILLLEVSKK